MTNAKIPNLSQIDGYIRLPLGIREKPLPYIEEAPKWAKLVLKNTHETNPVCLHILSIHQLIDRT